MELSSAREIRRQPGSTMVSIQRERNGGSPRRAKSVLKKALDTPNIVRDGRIVGKPSKWSVKLPRNRLRGHVLQQYLPNPVMDQNETSGQLPEATSTGRALCGQVEPD